MMPVRSSTHPASAAQLFRTAEVSEFFALRLRRLGGRVAHGSPVSSASTPGEPQTSHQGSRITVW